MVQFPEHVTLCDVTLRDGLQSEKEFVPTQKKLALYDALLASGIKHFEIGAFVSPRVIPQMQDSEEVIAKAKKEKGVVFQALVPNLIGAQRAVNTDVDELIYLSTASETYTKKNQNRTIDQVLEQLADVVKVAHEKGVKVRLGIGMSFDCPYEGPTPPDRVLRMIERGLEAGVDSIQPADSVGTATPGRVQELLKSIYDRWPDVDIGLHFHDNRGQALANTLAGIDAGCRHIDASLAGLGGTPIYAGSMGNACLEDMVYMLHGAGVKTGINLEKLVKAASLAEEVVGHKGNSHLLRAGIKPA
jgi:hydroxymethylglutaryl-CoA lyase